ncbi:MAG: hypothetical protein Kow0047_23440 [Anaerolineae bacterium]
MKGVGNPLVLALGNVILNPSVEDGVSEPSHWYHTPFGTEWATVGHHGNRSLRINAVNETPDWRCEQYAVRANARYRLRLWVKGAGSDRLIVAVRWFASFGYDQWIGEEWVPISGTYPDWTAIVQDVVAPSNSVAGDIMFRVWEPRTLDVYGDDFALFRIT